MGRAPAGRADRRRVVARSGDARGIGVAMTIQAFAPTVGGGELQLERLLPLLHQRGIRACVLTRAVAGMPRRDVVAGTNVYRTRVAGETPAASAVYVTESLAQLLRAWQRIDVVHAHGALSPATIALAARALGKRCVVTILGAGPPGDLARLRRKPAGRLRLALLARFATFIALSSEVATELRAAGVPGMHVVVIANGVDLTEYSALDPEARAESRAELGLDPNRCYGIFVGRLHPVKSVDTLVRALVDTTGIDLLIVGDGQERARLERLACDLRVSTRIRFIGSTPHVANYLKVADAFFLPSLGEGMPNALLEAMACGLPCVASSSVGGVEELLGDARGLTVPVGDVPAWSEVMQRLTSDSQLRHALGEAASGYVRARHSIDATADQLVTLYRALVARR
jgi:glycosyltransferase involved in cell wall biosynthesis